MNFSKKITLIIICISVGVFISKIWHNSDKNKSAAIVTGHPEATKIGEFILNQGGNAIDASIATQLALAVCFPRAGNIGGGGFMIYRTKEGESYSLDFREKAPKKSTKNMYLDSIGNVIDYLSTHGVLSIGVPGTISGIFDAHQKFGSLSIEELFNPAIKLAENGFQINERQANLLNKYKEDFIKYNHNNNYFVKDSNWKSGDTLIQKDLANTLKIIRDKKRQSFYNGAITKKIIQSLGAESILSEDDFKDYKSVWRKPITAKINNYKIISMPPPSSGGIALSQLLLMYINTGLKDIKHNSVEYIHLLSEIEKLIYADRSKYLGDSDFYNVPTNELMNTEYIKNRLNKIDVYKANPSKNINPGSLSYSESEETTHFSIVDFEGNAVSVTTTLNTNFGSKVFVDELGFLLNNEMDDFSSKPGHPNTYGLIGSEANSIEPEKRMLSSMTPTIIEKNGELFLVLGSPGGSTIITSIFQTILNVILFEMDIQRSVNSPRFHHQWLPDMIYLEKNSFPKTTLDSLKKLGHIIKQRSSMGHVNAIHIDGKIDAGADKRGSNAASILSNYN